MNYLDTAHAEVVFSTETGDLALRGSAVKGDINSDIIQIVTQRDMAGDNCVFEVTLPFKSQWQEVIRPNDKVTIKFSRASKGEKTVMVGLVDDVRSNLSSQAREIVVTGRGLSKALANFELGVISSIQGEIQAYHPAFTNTYYQGKEYRSAADNILHFYDVFIKHSNYKFSDGTTYDSILSKNITCLPEAQDHKIINFTHYTGSMWNVFKQLKGEPFHELYFEVIGNAPTLVFRPTPFEPKDWKDLKTYTIDEDEIQSISVGCSDLETFTVYKIEYGSMETAIDNVVMESTVKPFYNPEYYKKYGLKSLIVQVPYFNFFITPDGDGSELKNSITKWQTMLYNWYIHNNSYLNGSVELVGNPFIEIGNKAEILGNTYYIESVAHTFKSGELFTTSLQLTRGYNEGTRFASPKGEMVEYDAKLLAGYR